MGLGLALVTILLLTDGVLQGNAPDFAHQWQTNRFIPVMGIDFCLLGPLFSLCVRPPLQAVD